MYTLPCMPVKRSRLSLVALRFTALPPHTVAVVLFLNRYIVCWHVNQQNGTLQPIECKAAIAWEAKKPLEVKTVTVGPPGPGEVRIKASNNFLLLGAATVLSMTQLVDLFLFLADTLHSFVSHRCFHPVRRRCVSQHLQTAL